MKRKPKILVVGLGYVGLPLAIELSKYFEVLGFDKNRNRIKNLLNYYDENDEFSAKELKQSKFLKLTNKLPNYKTENIIIVTLPTPITKSKIPDLQNIKKFNLELSKIIKKNDIIIYESTVYPGCTEEIFIPQLSKKNNLIYNKDFFVGYSPERINPGDKKYNLTNISKVISASNKKTLDYMDYIYSKIIKAKIIKAKSIKIAEAAKVIENTQRDVNIALVNEFSLIFDKLNLNTHEVLKVASSKWNFLNFKPGLVGGHCIGIDPYYLAYKSKQIGINPQLILSGRKINDEMKNIIIKKIYQSSKKKKINILNSRILICGITFKENCSDIRNSQVIQMYNILYSKVKNIHIYDPLVKKQDLPQHIKNNKIKSLRKNFYDIIIIAVPHDCFKKNIIKFKNSLKSNSLIVDLSNNFFPYNAITF